MRDPLETNTAVCEALGLDPNRVTEIVITITPHDTPRVAVKHQPLNGDVSDVLREYTLTPIQEPTDD